MIHDHDLPMFLWVKSFNTIVYIKNRCPHRNLEDKTPMKAVNGVKLELSHFGIFGCTFYIHILVEKMTKLKPSNMKGFFFGYSDSLKAYKVFILD